MLRLALASLLCLAVALAPAWAIEGEDPENLLYLDVGSPKETYGRVVIRLRPDLAPQHVERIKTLAREGFYDGLKFHRVIPGFMAQTGDPAGTGAGRSSKPNLPAEFTEARHIRGMVSMARQSEDINSANSQFFIMLNDRRILDGQYSIWGEVIGGMEHVDRLKPGEEADDGVVRGEPDRIVRMRVAADVNE